MIVKKEYIIPTSECIALLTADILTESGDDVGDDNFDTGDDDEKKDDTYVDDFAPVA